MPDTMPPPGRVAIVTGASSGIGAAMAECLGRESRAVIVNYAGSAAEADKVVAAILAAGGRAQAVRADVGDPAAVTALFDAAEAAFGPVGILVNNAGRAIRKDIAAFTDAEFEAVIKTNLFCAFHAMREAATRLEVGGRMSTTANCPTCGARCRIEHRAGAGPRLRALQDAALVAKIEQLKRALAWLRVAAKGCAVPTRGVAEDEA